MGKALLRIDNRELEVSIPDSYMQLLCQRSWIPTPEGEPALAGDPGAWLRFDYAEHNQDGVKVLSFSHEYESDPYPGGTTDGK